MHGNDENMLLLLSQFKFRITLVYLCVKTEKRTILLHFIAVLYKQKIEK